MPQEKSTGKKSTGNPAIYCLLAMPEAGFTPDQNISMKEIMLALTRATLNEAKIDESRQLTDIFVEELGKIVDGPERASSTQQVIYQTEQAMLDTVGKEDQYEKGLESKLAITRIAALMMSQTLSNKADFN